ncbi:MAG: transcriptional repressor [Verrucomicrobia bacterium]|nr:MAG: transcriptional repressor [Verrucomicrobiota bacterium]
MVNHPESTATNQEFPEEISGLRMTRQRLEVYRCLHDEKTHPTAVEVFMRVKDRLPHISLATVYNCLEALVQHGVIRQVNFERESSRYCANMIDHGHFLDVETGKIYDLEFKPGVCVTDFMKLPEGIITEDIDITVRGKFSKN